ncbi:MAG: DUF6286 domain-containing protein [Corynebacterium sp.]|uniref:DUF6286 domain-containing protein n=1 Tax=Corynebacterium sp. TaxID=1720 RepID=UPI0026DF8765|nr:DUF6286 domain-containing protein [Corynebacterium sp.]MDO5670990.1 DUF6286 domain-containing protein [Corynebacterium sp.]
MAILIGLILFGVAIVCGREIWLRNSRSIDWDTWVEPIFMTIGDATYEPWMLPTGIAAALLGIFLVWVALRPRIRTHRRIRAAAPVWMRPVDISRLLAAAARGVPGVSTAVAHVSGGSAVVSVTGHQPDLAPLIDATLTPLIEDLGLNLSLKVRQRPLQEVEK